MIKKLIKDVVSKLSVGSKVECVIDEEVVDCSELEAPVFECGSGHMSHGFSPYTGVPAPVVTSSDAWFGEPVLTEKGWDVVQQEAKIKEEEVQRKEEIRSSGGVVEDQNIHEKMYELATKNWTTVDRSTFSAGGSENFQEGWNSGTGMNQFKNDY